MTVTCKESERIDAERVCQLWVGLSPSKCLPCAQGVPWPDEQIISPPLEPGRVLVVPSRFTTMPVLRMHIERQHGQWGGDLRTLKVMVREHAAMHDGDQAPTRPYPIPHIHENVEQWSVLRLGGP